MRHIGYMCAALLCLCSAAAAEPPARLMLHEQEAKYRALFPTLDDPDWQRVLDSPALILYDETTVPPAYQNDEGGFVSIFHNPAGRLDTKFGTGNPNREFPWKTAGGTDDAKGIVVCRMMKLPKRPEGGHWPIVWWESKLKMTFFVDETTCIRWIYPRGTVFGELLLQTAPDGTLVPFELRFRERLHDSWDVAAFRPFPTGADFVRRVKELRPDWQKDPKLSRLVRAVELEWKFPKSPLRDSNPDREAFRSNLPTFQLPPIGDDQLAKTLLASTPWEDASGDEWADDVHAPTAASPTGLHIVPHGYKAHGFAVDSDSCMRCHSHTNHAARLFDNRREWYGRVRGSDGIFSFHPIAPTAISQTGRRKQVEFRESLVKARLIEEFSTRRHPDDVYHQLTTMKE